MHTMHRVFLNIFVLWDIIIDILSISNTHRNCILLFFPLTTLLPARVKQAGLQVFFLLVVLGIWSFTTIFKYMYVISTSIISLWVKKKVMFSFHIFEVMLTRCLHSSCSRASCGSLSLLSKPLCYTLYK